MMQVSKLGCVIFFAQKNCHFFSLQICGLVFECGISLKALIPLNFRATGGFAIKSVCIVVFDFVGLCGDHQEGKIFYLYQNVTIRKLVCNVVLVPITGRAAPSKQNA